MGYACSRLHEETVVDSEWKGGRRGEGYWWSRIYDTIRFYCDGGSSTSQLSPIPQDHIQLDTHPQCSSVGPGHFRHAVQRKHPLHLHCVYINNWGRKMWRCMSVSPHYNFAQDLVRNARISRFPCEHQAVSIPTPQQQSVGLNDPPTCIIISGATSKRVFAINRGKRGRNKWKDDAGWKKIFKKKYPTLCALLACFPC